MRKVVYDIEANGLQPDRIWCVVAKDIRTNEVFTFLEHQREDFNNFCKEVETFIGHNIIQYDNYWVNKIWNIDISTEKSIDTLVLSRLFNSCKEVSVRDNKGNWEKKVKQKRRKDEHSLNAWGRYLKFPKGDYTDFSKFTPEMLEYCIRDVDLNLEVYKYLVKNESRGFSKLSIQIEQKLVEILAQQMRDGFKIDIDKAERLLVHCTREKIKLEEQMQKDFPPLPKLVKTYIPRLNKDGETYNLGSMGPMKEQYGFSYHGEPYSFIEWVEFNLSSPKQVLERLEGHWSPIEFTKKGQPKLSDNNLETILDTAPESIKKIKLYRMYVSRCNELEAWIEGARRHPDGRLRGTIYHLGSWSGRASHNDPNTANITSVSVDKKTGEVIYGEKGNYGYECRDVWTVEEGNVLVGCDASGIQLRILAHYLNNKEFTQAVLGKPHDYNARTLQTDRDTAKTFIYSWLLGAGVAKTALILSCTPGEAVNTRNRFVKLTPGLEDFLKRKTMYAQRGWYKGLDGRKVYLPSDHLALTAFLQNGEHIIMALANIYWTKWAKERGIPYKQCGYIHDEWQVETPKKYAKELGYLMTESFVKAGEYLKLNCPLAGEYKVGNSWAETH